MRDKIRDNRRQVTDLSLSGYIRVMGLCPGLSPTPLAGGCEGYAAEDRLRQIPRRLRGLVIRTRLKRKISLTGSSEKTS